MSQNYSELRKDNVRDAIYEDVANNLEVLRTSWSGNAFPENPKVGQPCYRTDEDNLYYWDGIEWSQKGGGGAAKMKVMELPASGTERYSVELEGGRCLDKNVMFVFVDKVAQEPSTYDLNSDGTVVNFTPAIPANAALTLRWFSSDVGTTDTSIIATDEEVSAGVAIDKVPNVSQLSTSIGKVPVGVKTYISSLVYKSGEVVISSGENVTMYKSLVDGNTGHALTETEYWEEISLGGGVDLNTGDKVYDWIGTLAEYEAQQIETLHPEYLCFITDDEGENKYATRSLDNLDESGKNVIKSIIRLVTELPETPEEGVLYCIPEA